MIASRIVVEAKKYVDSKDREFKSLEAKFSSKYGDKFSLIIEKVEQR